MNSSKKILRYCFYITILSIFVNYAISSNGLLNAIFNAVYKDVSKIELNVEDTKLKDIMILDNKDYISTSSDPWILIDDINGQVHDVNIDIIESSLETFDIQVYYSEDGTFSEPNSVKVKAKLGPNSIEINQPKNISAIRLDVTSNDEHTFKVGKIVINEQSTPVNLSWVNCIRLSAIIAYMYILSWRYYRKKNIFLLATINLLVLYVIFRLYNELPSNISIIIRSLCIVICISTILFVNKILTNGVGELEYEQ